MDTRSLNLQPVTPDIIGREPTWIVKSGIGLISFIFFILLFSTWFIKYPDTITAKVMLQTAQATVMQRAEFDSHIASILINDGDLVHREQPLIKLNGNISHDSIESLLGIVNRKPGAIFLDKFAKDIIAFGANHHLGDMQETFNELWSLVDNWRVLQEGEQLKHKTDSTNELLKRYKNLLSQLTTKRENLVQMLELACDDASTKEELAKEGMIQRSEYLDVKQRYLNQLSQLNDNQVALELYRLQINELEISLSGAELLQDKDLLATESAIKKARVSLINQIKKWQSTYVVYAKSDGQISYNQVLKQHQFLKHGQVMFSITPTESRMEAWMKIKGRGLSRIESGLRVRIELDSFSTSKFGYIEAIVDSFSPIPDEQGYLLTLSLPSPVVFSSGKALEGFPYVEGNAKIIFKSKRLLTHFTEKIIH